VSEGRHDRRAAGAADALVCGDQFEVAEFIAQTRVGHRLDGEDHFEVRGIGDRIVETDRRVA
jgi:hypothetical protein